MSRMIDRNNVILLQSDLCLFEDGTFCAGKDCKCSITKEKVKLRATIESYMFHSKYLGLTEREKEILTKFDENRKDKI